MKEQDDRRPCFSTSEVAELFGVTRTTLDRWIKEGKIPEPARNPKNGWPIWQQPDLDAVAKALNSKGLKTRRTP